MGSDQLLFVVGVPRFFIVFAFSRVSFTSCCLMREILISFALNVLDADGRITYDALSSLEKHTDCIQVQYLRSNDSCLAAYAQGIKLNLF